MRINILKGRTKYLVIISLLLMLSVFVYISFFAKTSLGNEYEYVAGREDDIYIRKNGEIAIGPTIIDIDVLLNNVVGLKIPAQYLECESGYNIKLNFKKEYFILQTATDDIFNYTSQQEFEKKLSELNILVDVNLDYQKFESIWERYSNYYEKIDFSTCVQLKK